MAHYITSVLKDSGGEISGYQLDYGQVITKPQGVAMAKEGLIAHVTVSRSKLGEDYLRSIPDDDPNNNLSNLPIITDESLQ